MINILPFKENNTTNLHPETLENLFSEASRYGVIYLHQSEIDKTFNMRITFHSIEHTKLEANSGFNHETIQSALRAAIKKAKQIKEQFK